MLWVCKFAKSINWQHRASYMHSSHRGVPGGAKSATACITSLHVWVKIILAVSTLTSKLPNLIPRQIFRLYGSYCGLIIKTKPSCITECNINLLNSTHSLECNLCNFCFSHLLFFPPPYLHVHLCSDRSRYLP